MSGFAESKTNADVRSSTAAPPVLQMRAPTGKVSGPSVTLLLSSPMVSHVMGRMLSVVAAAAVPAGSSTADTTAPTATAAAHRSPLPICLSPSHRSTGRPDPVP
jgi:hypothetical protein